MFVEINDKLSSSGLQAFLIGRDPKRDSFFISELLASGTIPLFEHSSFHIFGPMSFNNQLYAISGSFGSAVLVVSPQEAYLFSPAVADKAAFSRTIDHLLNTFLPLQIRYLSKRWIDSYLQALSHHTVAVTTRSFSEAIYDVRRLSSLEGSDFRNLRTRRRKLLESGRLRFDRLDSRTLPDALSVIERWQETQGHKYTKNRLEREIFTLEKFVSLSASLPVDSSFEVGYINAQPVSIACFYRSELLPHWGTIHFVKGLNRPAEYGFPGVSDSTYCHVFQLAERSSITHLNDGELGTETGTRRHKLQFRPVCFLQSFDITVNP